jgi:hypothetical protein
MYERETRKPVFLDLEVQLTETGTRFAGKAHGIASKPGRIFVPSNHTACYVRSRCCPSRSGLSDLSFLWSQQFAVSPFALSRDHGKPLTCDSRATRHKVYGCLNDSKDNKTGLPLPITVKCLSISDPQSISLEWVGTYLKGNICSQLLSGKPAGPELPL